MLLHNYCILLISYYITQQIKHIYHQQSAFALYLKKPTLLNQVADYSSSTKLDF